MFLLSGFEALASGYVVAFQLPVSFPSVLNVVFLFL